MRAKKLRKIKLAVHEVMLNNKLDKYVSNGYFGNQPEMRESERMFIYIEIINTNPRLSYVFNSNETIVVGRALENTICIQELEVSKRQCEIFEYKGLPYVRNLSKHNQISVKHGMKKELLNYGEAAPLYKKDIIRIGSSKIQVVLIQGQDYIIN